MNAFNKVAGPAVYNRVELLTMEVEMESKEEMKNTESKFISDFGKTNFNVFKEVAWPSGLRRWFKAPVSSEAWVRIPPLPETFDF